MSATLLLPNNELVASAWIQTVLNQVGGVGSKLPGDQSSWKDTGFVQITVVGGSSSPYMPLKSPVIGCKCTAVNPGGRFPPWDQANQLAERIRGACFTAQQAPQLVALPSGYEHAAVRSVYLLNDPKRLGGDDSAYARYQFDLQMHWTGVAL
jgi:hypothetical protein